MTLGLVVAGAGTETRVQIEYLSQIHEHATSMSRNGDALRSVAGRIETIARDEFVTVLDGIETDIDAALAFVAEDPPNPDVLPVRSLFRQALMAWDAGVTDFKNSILEAADFPNDLTVVDRIAAALAELRAGDAVYQQLVVELERDDLPDPLSPLPHVAMSPGQGGLVNMALGFSSAARSPNNTLTLRPGLRVSSIVAEPSWQVDASGDAVLQATETVTFSVVVSNMGNVESGTQELELTLTGENGDTSLSLTVEPLAPGLQITMTFEALDVEPGGSYQVTAELVAVGNDVDFADNLVTVEFTVNSD